MFWNFFKRKSSKPVFSLSEEDFMSARYRFIEGVRAGRRPRTTDAAELLGIYGEVSGIVIARNKLIASTLEKGVSRLISSSEIPAGWIHFAGIRVEGKLFVMKEGVAAELRDIEEEIGALYQPGFFTNKIYEPESAA